MPGEEDAGGKSGAPRNGEGSEWLERRGAQLFILCAVEWEAPETGRAAGFNPCTAEPTPAHSGSTLSSDFPALRKSKVLLPTSAG